MRGHREETLKLLGGQRWLLLALLLKHHDERKPQHLQVTEGLLHEAGVEQSQAVDELEGLHKEKKRRVVDGRVEVIKINQRCAYQKLGQEEVSIASSQSESVLVDLG